MMWPTLRFCFEIRQYHLYCSVSAHSSMRNIQRTIAFVIYASLPKLKQSEAAKIANYELDIILRLSPSPCRLPVLQRPFCPIWSADHLLHLFPFKHTDIPDMRIWSSHAYTSRCMSWYCITCFWLRVTFEKKKHILIFLDNKKQNFLCQKWILNSTLHVHLISHVFLHFFFVINIQNIYHKFVHCFINWWVGCGS